MKLSPKQKKEIWERALEEVDWLVNNPSYEEYETEDDEELMTLSAYETKCRCALVRAARKAKMP